MSVDKNKNRDGISLPNSKQLEKELMRVEYRKSCKSIAKNALTVLLVTASLLVLLNNLLLPLVKIEGNSMSPSVNNGSIAVVLKHTDLDKSDICCFYNDNIMLCKRIVASAGDVVNIDEDGNVFVNGVQLSEPYIDKKSLGKCEIEFPYVVPDDSYFVMGDNRATSIDSRSYEIGCVPTDRIVGKMIFCIWPISDFGIVD